MPSLREASLKLFLVSSKVFRMSRLSIRSVASALARFRLDPTFNALLGQLIQVGFFDYFPRQGFQHQHRLGGEKDGTRDDILQLQHISREIIAFQGLQIFRADRIDMALVIPAHPPKRVLRSAGVGPVSSPARAANGWGPR